MAISSIEHVSVGMPITRGGISIFPIYLGPNGLPRIATGAKSGLVVDEVPDEEVPHLVVTNPTDQAILIVEGEQLVGGLQNRSPNVSVLVPAHSKLEIPVSCLESGRWGRHEKFHLGATYTPRRVRRTKSREVAKTMASDGLRSGNQGAVWDAVQNQLYSLDVHSSTGAMADADEVYERDPNRHSAAEELAGKGPLPGQVGIVVAHGQRVVASEIFGAPNLLQAHWTALIRSHLLESPTSEGHPSATSSLEMIRLFGVADSAQSPGIGLGYEYHVNAEDLNGHALVLDDFVVHASIFAK